jgi:hypothetical protein
MLRECGYRPATVKHFPFPLETIASTQKVLADVAAPRDLSKASLSHPILRFLRPAPPLSGVRGISFWRLGRKTGGGKTRPYGNLTHTHLPISPNLVLLSRSTTKAVHLTKTVKRCMIEGIRFKIRHAAHGKLFEIGGT